MIKTNLIGLLLFGTIVQLFGQDTIPNNLPDSLKKGIEEGKYVFLPGDKSAEYPGGIPKFYSYIDKNLKYPKNAKKNKATGRVYVEFVINRDGSIDAESVKAVPASELRIPEGMNSRVLIDSECEQEAIRLIRQSGNWIPASQKDKPVRQKMVIPILFKL